jgi:hypothetical protein
MLINYQYNLLQITTKIRKSMKAEVIIDTVPVYTVTTRKTKNTGTGLLPQGKLLI